MSEQKASSLRNRLVPAIVVIAALILGVTAVTMGGNGDSGTQAETPTSDVSQQPSEEPDLTVLEARDPDDVQALGPVDAPVGLVVYSDYQCPYCSVWFRDTFPEMRKYVDSGDLRVEWRDVNVFGKASERAARAAHAAGLQDHFWEYHAELFPDGERLPESELTDEALADRAEDLGLDRERFESDMNSDEVRATIAQHAAQGQQIGVRSTPAFILGGEPIMGAQPTEVFVDTMETKLAEAPGN
ncbi:DsbA family protein [Propioniferax innocua]|uniref:DsbA family protein n=1 Tax=Propioniferax innocua TaxID=1753 RepID=UPI0031D000D1